MVKKKGASKKRISNSVEKAMLENFVEIQKVMVDLSIKLGDLSTKISRLLDLFETTAKTMSSRGMGEENKEVIKKMDSLLEQNKTIAKGLSMMYENSSSQKAQNLSQNRFKQYP